jgi:hypothetical protein
MKTVYVVTSGEYSDYGLNGLFSTPEKAQAFMDKNKIELCCGRGQIEEWELDELVKHTTKTVWFCRISIHNGDLNWEYNSEVSCPPRYKEVHTNRIHAWARSSISQKHAHKLAVEKRQEVLRLREASK